MRYELETGVLQLQTSGGSESPLFEIGERINPKRAFVFVSTCLGRHIPVRPSDHNAAVSRLAERVIQAMLPGPALVMSYAETAVGLGANLARALWRLRPARELLFLPTTRHPIEGRTWFTFSEDHSHASFHAVIRPDDHPAIHGQPGRTLVLVDDETTTGSTFAALAAALRRQAGLTFDRALLVTLTDWSAGRAETAVSATSIAADVVAISLEQGQWTWTPSPDAPPRSLPEIIAPATPAFVPDPSSLLRQAPRFGVPASTLCTATSVSAAAAVRPAAGKRSLVIGSGEHVWTPFLIAEDQEAAGVETAFLSTTRSPILKRGPIREKIVFPDHFGIGIEMYLHNVHPDEWDSILLCVETSVDGVPAELRQALGKGMILDGAGRLHDMISA